MKNLNLWKSLAAIALMLVACQNSNPPDSSDPLFKPENNFGAAAPSDAKMVTPEEFKALSLKEGFTIDTLKLRADRKAAATAQFKTDNAAVKQLAAQYPAYNKALAEPDLTDPSLKILPDGNYRLTIQGATGPFQVVTDGKPSMYRDMLESKKRFENPSNQLRVYRSSYFELPEALKTGLPTPDSLAGANLEAILAARTELGKHLAANPAVLLDAQAINPKAQTRTVPPFAKPANYPATPELEEGAGKGLDRSGTCTPKIDGLYQNFWWRQKFYATSVKTQGQRGVCVAFALTAALETRIAIEQSRYVNLSEQFLWGQIASVWDPKYYGEGTILPNRAEDFQEQHYALPLEQVWNYNTSNVRHASDVLETYLQSCDGYDEYCSEASHQLQLVCTNTLGVTLCGYSMPAATGERFQESKPDTIFDWYNDAFGLPVNEMRLKLSQGHPVVAGLLVKIGFMYPNNQGYVTTLSDINNWGRHAVQVVGFVSNADIQANPNISSDYKALSADSDGGYFIIKNSWGCTYGDAGYVYVPVSWAKAYFTQVTVFDSHPSAEFKSTPNQAPTVTITAPTTGSSFPFAQVTTYTADVTDPDSPANSLDITWTSDVDGVLGTGSSINKGFSTPGARKITVTVTDDHGATANASINVTGINLAPKVFIDAPLPGDVIWAGSTNVTFKGSSIDGDGIFGTLPCTSLVWKSSNSSDVLGSGCTFSTVFATTGFRTITLTGTDAYGSKGSASIQIGVTTKPLSGPPTVKILNPIAGKQYPQANVNLLLNFSNDDPGGTTNSQYTVVWRINDTVITPKTCKVGLAQLPCFNPSDYGYSDSPAHFLTLKLTVTDPENLTGTDSVLFTIGVPG